MGMGFDLGQQGRVLEGNFKVGEVLELEGGCRWRILVGRGRMYVVIVFDLIMWL